MSSTESEDFESADEDYSNSPSRSVQQKEVDQPATATTNKQENITFPNKLLPEVEKTNSNNKNFTESKPQLEKSIEVSKKEEPETERVSKPILNIIPKKEPERWSVDNLDMSNVERTEILAAQKPVDNSEDGWEDFDDDWGEEESSNAKQSEQPLSSVFPVLDCISPGKQTKNDGMILSNSAKPKLKSEIASTYDAFPVLNQITGKGDSSNVEDKFRAKNEVKEEETDPRFKEKSTSLSSTSSWGWKPWGGVVSTILSTATEGVTSLTTHVSQGLSNVIESGMGVPDPEELAKLNKEREKSRKSGEFEEAEVGDDNQNVKRDILLPSLGNIVSGVTHIGNKVILGGLDTLEGIGKKTMTILQENDPLLLNKRKMLGFESEKPILSQILREAKEKSEEIERNLKQMQRSSYKKQLHFETLFDQYYGLVHLEALEMLSKQSSIKLKSLMEPLTGKALSELQETLDEVKELCELGDLENEENDGNYSSDILSKKLLEAVEDLDVQTDFKDILKCWDDNLSWLKENEGTEAQEVYEKGLRCLSETSALAMNKYHKLAEMLLIKDHHSTANEADSLVQLTTALCWHLNGIANHFGAKLNSFEQNEETSPLITSIFVEVYNSNSYVKSAFQLFIPILQIGAA